MLTLNVMKQPIDQSWSIERIATEAPPVTWEKVFEDAKHELHDISMILDEQERTYGPYYPLKKDIFAAFNYTPLTTVKVVIIGQDPYHQTITVNGTHNYEIQPSVVSKAEIQRISMPRAVGLSFSVRREDTIPSSLQNIYAELANTMRGFVKPDHGDLREWARQGVLLLNSCLTVRPGQPKSHGDIWLGFINKVFKAIAAVNPYCVYMLWGQDAQKLRPMVGERSVVLEAAHPSGLSARRGFFGSNHFNLANDALIRQGKVGINWKISSLTESNSPPNKQNPVISPVTTNHHPILTPINVEMLPTIILFKSNTGNPIIIGNSLGNSLGTSPPQSAVLPIIPNTKPIVSEISNTKHIVIKPPSPRASTMSEEKITAPTIPKIQFGTAFNVTPAITIGTPQIIIPKYIPSVSNKSTISVATTTGLPIIPTLIK